ncbi:hypothetical protein EIP91_009921 [Steccherinum ochraceum]|uniref:Piwi domain-containing protein n=1 Tax=Steccherinum ochraceum TaxID=92696 RepID=A0A4R0R6J1_9APHY|nr:hypothetical protein EIP91_009921 [Steccherinum ochraceum]
MQLAVYGQNAQSLKVLVNYFRVKSVPNANFYLHTVGKSGVAKTISYKEERPGSRPISTKTRLEVFAQVQIEAPHVFDGTTRAVYDGASILYSRRAIPQSTFETVKGMTAFVVRLSLDSANIISARDLQALLNQGGGNVGNSLAARTLLQHLIRATPMKTGWLQLKKNSFYTDHREKHLTGGLIAWKGFSQSVRPGSGGLFVNVDVSNIAVYEPGDIVELAMQFLGTKDVRKLRDMEPARLKRLERFLKGLQIHILLGPHRGRVWARPKRISGLVTSGGYHTFMKDNNELTVQAYIEGKYNQRLREPKIFGIRVGTSAVFPAEFCEVMSGQPFKKRLDDEQQRRFIENSTQDPFQRLQMIQDSVSGPNQVFQYSQSPALEGLSIQTRPEDVNAIVLPPAKLDFAGSSMTVKYGKWRVDRVKYSGPGAARTFAVLIFAHGILPVVRDFVSALIPVGEDRVSRNPRIQPRDVYLEECNPANVAGALARITREKFPGVAFLLVVLPASAPFKREIKHWSILKGLPTQCIRDRKFSTKNQYLNNVMLKINAKIGGYSTYVPWLKNLFPNEVVLVMGCDVSHPAPGSNKPSVASLVLSCNREMTSYIPQISVQEPRTEIIREIGPMFKKALAALQNLLKTKNGLKYVQVDHLIVFRDGVSEGEYQQVQQEIDDIEAMLQEYYTYVAAKYKVPKHKPAITFMIVTKRHHTRFFIPQEMARQDKQLNNNCPAGLLVTQTIVPVEYENFYLQSHGGLKGSK